MQIQSPARSMSLMDNWMPDTKPSIESLKISIRMAAEAPSPASRCSGDMLSRVLMVRIMPIQTSPTCMICTSPLSGLSRKASWLRKMPKIDENQYDDDAVNDAELAEPAEDFGLVRKGQRQQHVNDQYRY